MMDNPTDNSQEPMNYKAAKMVYQLVESTERFLTTVGDLDTQLLDILNMKLDINYRITKVIQEYGNVCMIVNALQAISLCISDPQHRNSLLTAATSASTSASTSLSRIYSQFETIEPSTLRITDPAARESLTQLGLLVQQSKLVNVKLEESSTSNTASPQLKQTSLSPSPSSNQDIDNERRELALKRKQFDEEKEEFERERKRLLLDKESANQQLREQQLIEQQAQQLIEQQAQQQQQQKLLVEQQQQQQQQQQQERQKQQEQQQQQRVQLLEQLEQRKMEIQQQKQRHEQQMELERQEREQKQKEQQQDKENLIKQKHPIHVLSTDQFLEQFERTAQTFAQSIHMNIDNVWESMLIHALPKDKLPWANETIFGKKHSWRYAKQMYHAKYAGNSGSAPSSPTGQPAIIASSSSSIPTAPTAAFAATSAVVQATSGAASNGVMSVTSAPTITTTTTFNAPLSPLQKLLARPAPSATDPPPKERDQRRVADYCQHLLSLEMKFYDTIEEYNKRYLRYCTIANVDLTGKSFIERYIRSLDPKYRDIVHTALQLRKQPLNDIKQVMAVAEETINAYIAASPPRSNAPYSQDCIHNRKINQAV